MPSCHLSACCHFIAAAGPFAAAAERARSKTPGSGPEVPLERLPCAGPPRAACLGAPEHAGGPGEGRGCDSFGAGDGGR